MADSAAPAAPTSDPRRARLQAAQPSSSPAPTLDAAPAETPAQEAKDDQVAADAPPLTAEPQAAPVDEAQPADPLPQSQSDSAPPADPTPAEGAQPESEAAAPDAAVTNPDLDAAIAATLAMETEAPEEVASTAAGAPAETAGRGEAGTPALYGGASSADVPGNVATPPLAASPSTAPEAAPTANGNSGPSSAAAAPKLKAASSLSRVAQLTARVERDPLDGEAQLALLQDAEAKGDLERTREVYEKFLTVFPDASEQWIGYCHLELAHNNFSRVEDIFARCLRTSTSVDLWRFYLNYIRRVNPVDPANFDQAKQARSVISSAFEFALGHVNHDRRAGEIWGEYISFLREGQTRGTWEEQQKMDALRKAFQRAVQSPINNVEGIWQEYNAFENNLSKMTAKKFIAELSPSYMTARKTLRELRAQHDNLVSPPLPRRPDWQSGEDRDGLERWKRYLAYEESNPLEIEDPIILAQRVAFVYRHALAMLRFYPEIWYLSANFHLRLNRVDDGRKLLRDGMTANPASLLLSYTLADLEEGKQDLASCYSIYDSLIAHLYERVAQLEAAVEAEVVEAVAEHEEKVQVKAEGGEGEAAKTEEEEDTVETREKKAQEVEAVRTEVRERRQPEIDSVKRAAANVWITEMRFARRSDGVKQARSVFLKARKAPHLAWQVVEASATMEMYWNSDVKVATNVFELGLKLFSAEPDYVLRYLDFLLQQNNANNARALFERTVGLIEPAKAKPIWDLMAQYEYAYGDYLAAQKMAQRYSETFPETSATVRFAQQHKYHGLEDAFAQDLGRSFVKQIKAERRSGSSSPPRSRTKRGHSSEPENGTSDGNDLKRPRHGPSPSPAPSSQQGAWPGGPQGGMDQPGFRRNAPEAAPALNRPMPYMLDPQGHNVAVLPDAVVFFLSLLPPASAFNGPHLNPANIMDIIGTTILPGSAPGPGLPGERLGIPPRPKPARPQGYGGGGPPGGGWGGRRY
ncbi:hypothetical protein JCM6882_001931 [Rhodosporidiobolus microsporus]